MTDARMFEFPTTRAAPLRGQALWDEIDTLTQQLAKRQADRERQRAARRHPSAQSSERLAEVIEIGGRRQS